MHLTTMWLHHNRASYGTSASGIIDFYTIWVFGSNVLCDVADWTVLGFRGWFDLHMFAVPKSFVTSTVLLCWAGKYDTIVCVYGGVCVLEHTIAQGHYEPHDELMETVMMNTKT